ncbi:hypothetical protein GmRootA79_51500 [Acidovorax sp. A79]|uniref:hypothetical protein n=1 Tax=Acidovorax sp. A79 TaxID=3056107 RepID=UPI0034E84AD4
MPNDPPANCLRGAPAGPSASIIGTLHAPFFSQKLYRHPANGLAGASLKSMYKFLSMQPQKQTSTNRCSFCGATSYRRVVARDAAGAMRYAERLVCTGCTREFPSVKVWREGLPDGSTAPAPAP